jgi:cyclomaltodextrinase / maltogenic alpha-amylase / neopullulanase
MPHVPPPATPISTRVRLELEAPPDAFPDAHFSDPHREHGWRVALSWVHEEDAEKQEGEPTTSTSDPQSQSAIRPGRWQAEILLPQEPTVLTYYFVLQNGAVIRERHQVEGEIELLYGVWEERDFQIAVYDPKDVPPDWLPGTIFYQIFPDRFAQGDPVNQRKPSGLDDGDLLYMSWTDLPEHPSRGRDFFGGDLRGVIEKLDYLEDLGVTCIYFTPIFASPSNHRYDATDYDTIDPRLGTEDDLKELIEKAGKQGIRVLLDGVFNHCSDQSIYFKDAQRSKESPYYRWFDFLHWPDRWVGWLGSRSKLGIPGLKHMPEFVECPEVEDFFFGQNGIAQRWLALGTVGWRTDVTPWVTDEFWRRFRRAVRYSYPDAYLVAEDWESASHRLVGDSFDALMNYRFGYSAMGFVSGKITASELDDRLETRRRDTPPKAYHAQMNILGSHDTARILTRLDGSKARVMLATALQLAYPGAPMIYYGDEAGVEGTYAENGRRPYPWGNEDRELLDFFRTAMNARQQSAALSKGEVTTVWIENPGGYGILRTHEGERVVALFNSSQTPLDAAVDLGDTTLDAETPDLLSGLPAARISDGVLNVALPPLTAAWFRLP